MIEMLPASKLKATSSPPSGFNARLTGDCPTSRRASNLSLCASFFWVSFLRAMLATCPDPGQETNAFVESGMMAMSSGWMQIVMAERTASRPAIQIEHRNVGRAGVGNTGAVRVRRHVYKVRPSANADGGHDFILLGVDHAD